jgi:hypothetical protein
LRLLGVPGIFVLPGTSVPETFTAVGTLSVVTALRIKRQLKFAPK